MLRKEKVDSSSPSSGTSGHLPERFGESFLDFSPRKDRNGAEDLHRPGSIDQGTMPSVHVLPAVPGSHPGYGRQQICSLRDP